MQFFSNRIGLDLGEAFFQSGLAIEQDFEVVGVFQISDQRGIGDHALEEPADGVVSTFAPDTAPKVAKKSFHNIIGSLRLDWQWSVGSFESDGIGEEFFSIFVDLIHHGLPVFRGGVIGSGGDLFAELFDGFLNRTQGDGVAAGVQARGLADLSDAHRTAQLVEHFTFEIQRLQRAEQGLIRGDLLELAGEFKQRNVIAPLASEVDVFDLLEPLAQNPQPFGEVHQWPIKGEAVACPLGFAGERPLD